jgi:hypothetical protein
MRLSNFEKKNLSNKEKILSFIRLNFLGKPLVLGTFCFILVMIVLLSITTEVGLFIGLGGFYLSFVAINYTLQQTKTAIYLSMPSLLNKILRHINDVIESPSSIKNWDLLFNDLLVFDDYHNRLKVNYFNIPNLYYFDTRFFSTQLRKKYIILYNKIFENIDNYELDNDTLNKVAIIDYIIGYCFIRDPEFYQDDCKLFNLLIKDINECYLMLNGTKVFLDIEIIISDKQC